MMNYGHPCYWRGTKPSSWSATPQVVLIVNMMKTELLHNKSIAINTQQLEQQNKHQ